MKECERTKEKIGQDWALFLHFERVQTLFCLPCDQDSYRLFAMNEMFHSESLFLVTFSYFFLALLGSSFIYI